MQKNLKQSIFLALMAALYVVLTVALAPFSYGVIQFRISELLNHLMAYHHKFIISLGLGVLLANLFSSAGIYDVIFGTLGTVICCVIAIVSNRFIHSEIKRLAFNIFNFTFIGMIPIALMLYFLGFGEATLLATYLMLIPGELAAMTIGSVIFYIVNKQFDLKSLFN